MDDIAELIAEIKSTSANITKADEQRLAILNGIKSDYATLRTSLDDLYRRVGRPGIESSGLAIDERKSALEYLAHHTILKNGPSPVAPQFGSADIDQAVIAQEKQVETRRCRSPAEQGDGP
jgi:hypothetical protein